MSVKFRIASYVAFIAFFSPALVAEDSPRQSEYLLQWSPPIVSAIQTLTPSPCLASRNLAIIYIAAFNVVNATNPLYEFYAFDEFAPKGVNATVAAIAAVSYSSEIFFPSHRSSFRALQAEQYETLCESVTEENWVQSIAFGESVAKRIIKMRAGDGSTSMRTYIPKDEIGKWKRTPPRYRAPELSYWAKIEPFVMENGNQFRLPPPPDLDSEYYAQALAEVREIGSLHSRTRTEEQSEIAEFWSCFSYTSTPAGHWYEIATRLARDENLSLLETARLLALANIAMADAGIACWDTKYHYESWRPIQAIHAADLDGNPATEKDEGWNSMLESPPHPEYTSGHGAFSGAGGKILELFFDASEGYSFSTTNSSLPGVVRSYESFTQCVEEICLSRLYGGIHFRYSNDLGMVLGENVANYTFENVLRPLQ